MSLTEKYRPQTLDEIVAQPNVVKKVKLLHERGGLAGRVFWCVGASSAGKTSLARIVADMIADPICQFELDAQEYGLDAVRQFETNCQYKPFGKGCLCFVCNEAHRLSDRVVSRLQTVLEEPCVCKNSTWIFTTTNQGQESLFADKFDACPFLSRATILEFKDPRRSVLEWALHLQKIAQAEQLDGKPIESYMRLFEKCGFNPRAAINRIESGEMLT